MAAVNMQWPAALPPWMVQFAPQGQSKTGGQSIEGSEQIVVSPAARWNASVTLAIRGEESNLALQAFVAAMNGRAGTVLVPRWGRYRVKDDNGRMFSPAPAAAYGPGCNSRNFDLSGFGQQDVAYALTAAAALNRAVDLSIDVLNGEGPRPGHDVGIGMRLYRVTSAWQENEGDSLSVQVFPTLRSAVPEGARVIFDRPVCLMRFASDNEGNEALSRAGSGRVTMNFEEVSPTSETILTWAAESA